ncbi:MAG TPA: gliding motility-associated protein GldE [Bacteroidales bacterium]|nr:gliding motility-associated protein GldE [Bacteroidales bacterium]
MADPLPDAVNALIILNFASVDLVSSAGLIAGLAVTILLLLCSAAASASETAFFSLSPSQLSEIRSSKASVDKRIIYLLENSRLLLATILITNNLVNVGIVILSTFLVNHYLDFSANPLMGFLFQVVIITALLLLLGEIMPKVIATRKPVSIASMLATPLIIVQKILYPFSMLLVNSTRFVDKRQAQNHHITLDDISNAIDITNDGQVDEEDRKIMKSITRFGEINAREIMSPRVDLTVIDNALSFSEVQKIIMESGYSRIPVYNETPDTITGILYIKDLLPHLSENDTFAWEKLVRPPFFIPENKPINDLLQEFQEKKIHMAVVVDEYGGTSGIITLEDIIEEIVGEINDEFDIEADNRFYSRVDGHNYIFEGKTSINDMCRVLGLDDRIFDEAKGESESLAGLILELAGKMPSTGETFNLGEFIFRIEAADKRRIKKVKITTPLVDGDPY